MTEIFNFPKIFKNKKQFSIKAEGNSMLPVLRSGDLVYLKKIPFQEIRVNDIIYVYKNKTSFIHRVIYIKKSKVYRHPDPESDSGEGSHDIKNHAGKIRYIITKGDNNPKSDGFIYPRNVFGLVYQIKRKGKIFGIDDLYLIQSSIYWKEIIKVKNAFEKAKIDYVFLKGLPVHLYYEGTHPRRLYADCDILVNPKNRLVVENLFIKIGYIRIHDELPYLWKFLKTQNREISFYKSVNGFPVIFDLHFEPVFMINQIGNLNALYPQKLINELTDYFIDEIVFVNVQNNQFPILSKSNLLIYLALHYFHHRFRDIFRLDFMDKIVSCNKGDESKNIINFQNKVIDLKLQNYVYPSLKVLKRHFNTKTIEDYIYSIKPNSKKMIYINKNILSLDPYKYEEWAVSGTKHFMNLFYLSPNIFFKKVLIIINPQVINALFWILKRKLFTAINQISLHN
jgi:hypothetical protein